MTSYVTSTDGTRIAFDLLGEGPPVVVVGGILCDRQTTRELAERLADHLSVVNYDRRGRGESGDTPPYDVQREVEDLAALVGAVGGEAAVYGHSSGAGLAVEAAARGVPVTRLVLYEPPYGPDDEESTRSARELARGVRLALDEGRPADAVGLFFSAAGLPPEMVEAASRDPKTLAVAPTMPHDFAVMGDDSRGGAIPEDRVRAVGVPTLVVNGGASPDFFLHTANRLVGLLPDGRHLVLEGHGHDAPATVVAPVVAEFLTAAPTGRPAQQSGSRSVNADPRTGP